MVRKTNCTIPRRRPAGQPGRRPALGALRRPAPTSCRAAPRQRDAARELCDLDDAHQRRVFTQATRRKLERSLADRAVDGSNPSCPEAAIARAAEQLGRPDPPGRAAGAEAGRRRPASRSCAGRILTLACARLRLGGLMHQVGRRSTKTSTACSSAASTTTTSAEPKESSPPSPTRPRRRRHPARPQASAARRRRQQPSRSTGGPTSTTSRSWRRRALRRETCLTLRSDGEPTLDAFCSRAASGPRAPADPAQTPGPQAARHRAGALEGGLTPALLNGWVACLDRGRRRDAGSGRRSQRRASWRWPAPSSRARSPPSPRSRR